jgi:hypothetical protein
METGPSPKRLKFICQNFMLKQRNAPIHGLRDLLEVPQLDYILYNGKTYNYIVYITSLLLRCPLEKITIYRCKDGLWRDDESEEWEKITPDEALKAGVHLWSSSDGNLDFSVKLIEGIIDTIDIDPIYCVAGAGMKGWSKENTPSGSTTPAATSTTPEQAHTTPGAANTAVGTIALRSPSKTESKLPPLQIFAHPKSVLFHFIHAILTIDRE